MDETAPFLPSTSQGSPAAKLDPKLQRELTKINDSIPFNPKTRHLHSTWAQTFFSRPELYFQPTSIPELQKIVTLARRCRKRICVTGYGHSPSDLTCTTSWLINLDHISGILEKNVDNTPGRYRILAGISLHDLNLEVAKDGYTLPNLGSIDVQSVAGVISTGTHGSSLRHGLISESITSLTVLLSNSQLVTCSATKNPQLFQAALLSLGALGIIVEITIQTVPDFNIAWSQTLHNLSSVIDAWDKDLWTQDEYTRVWWCPYLHRAVIWRGHKTDSPIRPPNTTFYGGKLGFYIYHNLLYLSNYIPRILPWVEWFVFGMQYGFSPGTFSMSAVQPAREGLLMDCLYSQFVNEWALPLSKGPEAIHRLSAWINRDDATANIPISSAGVWVHCPIEVRVTHSQQKSQNHSKVRPYLDPTLPDAPTLYLNATLYRPYGRDPPCHAKYYEAFEYLMRELGGKPHWAKNFSHATNEKYVAEVYGKDMRQYMDIRDESDPEGMFLGEWHARNLPLRKSKAGLGMREEEISRTQKGWGWGFGDGLLWEGQQVKDIFGGKSDEQEKAGGGVSGFFQDGGAVGAKKGSDEPPSPPVTATSEESFDYMAKGEASVYEGRGEE